ncbi:glycoside hydrolase family 99 protein [Streptomyces fuscigenes]|uniref:glycoside hydrolase family 99 protein n=1 Tax=Streptomyces fuscigenes TaxID=1528880 RepID=UPI001F32BED1|nr:glycoside hydrolase family 99 protein [Streptomyces fuscigenes]MCF3962833.1 glycoside hydrolase family 99 protein [Streptomyces fuscigenes]
MSPTHSRGPSAGRRAFLAGSAAVAASAALGSPAGAAVPAAPRTAPAPAAAAATLSTNVHIFYYPWYGSPKVFGSYRHWPQGNLTPPNGISSNFYPTLGAYDSGDGSAVSQHMRWLRQAGTGVLVTSWWGQGSYEDQRVPLLLDQANAQGLKVAFHIEPYTGRSADSVVADVRYLVSRYGSHPAYFRDAAHGNRNAFYVFESLRITDWSPIEAVKSQAVVLTQTTDTSKAAHFGGMYTYDGIAASTLPDWSGVDRYCRANGLVWSPSFGPGYIDDRAVPGNTTPTVERANGSTYDAVWQHAITSGDGGAAPAWVSITSFNEWHEGSQIEPATATPPTSPVTYQTYDGAYGRSGSDASAAYLDRTQYWVQRYVARRGA